MVTSAFPFPFDVPFTTQDLDVMVRTVWGEARNQGTDGWEAVAWIIRTRATWRPQAWWGIGIAGVCQKAEQFSCWNENDPNRDKLEALSETDTLYQKISVVCDQVLEGLIADPTCGATHYEVTGTDAGWSRGRYPSAVIGQHSFYVIGP